MNDLGYRLAQLIEKVEAAEREEEETGTGMSPKELGEQSKEMWKVLRKASRKDKHLMKEILEFAIDAARTFKFPKERKLLMLMLSRMRGIKR